MTVVAKRALMRVSSLQREENDTLGNTLIVTDWGRIRPDLTGRVNKRLISAILQTLADLLGRTNGAQERTRTSTPLRAPAPEAGASTNSATWARGRSAPIAFGASACQRTSDRAR